MRRIVSVLVGLLIAGPAAAQDMPLSDVLLPGEGWHLVSEPSKPGLALATGPHGSVAVAAPEQKQILRIGKDGKLSAWIKFSEPVTALAYGSDGRLYEAQPKLARIVAWDKEGKETVIARDLRELAGLAVTRSGDVYCTLVVENEEGQVRLVKPDGKARIVARGFQLPSGLVLWPDQGTLVVADKRAPRLTTFRVEKDGRLTGREDNYFLRTGPGRHVGANALTLDRAGRLYAATREGVQIFDPIARLSGVLLKPQRADVTAVAFGGPELERLYIVCGGKLYVRKTKANVPPRKKGKK